MEVLEALRRRAMVRNFESKPLKDEEIRKLVYAATRAPSGGNMLSREIVVVDDPRYMRMLRDVTPSFLADAPSAIVICTDLEKANDLMGTQGRDILSLVDSGAAAENVAAPGDDGRSLVERIRKNQRAASEIVHAAERGLEQAPSEELRMMGR